MVASLFTSDSLAIGVACEVAGMVRRRELYVLELLMFLMYLASVTRCRQFANWFWLTLGSREKLFIERRRKRIKWKVSASKFCGFMLNWMEGKVELVEVGNWK